MMHNAGTAGAYPIGTFIYIIADEDIGGKGVILALLHECTKKHLACLRSKTVIWCFRGPSFTSCREVSCKKDEVFHEGIARRASSPCKGHGANQHGSRLAQCHKRHECTSSLTRCGEYTPINICYKQSRAIIPASVKGEVYLRYEYLYALP